MFIRRIAIAGMSALAALTLLTPPAAADPPPNDRIDRVDRPDDSRGQPTDRSSQFGEIFDKLPGLTAQTNQEIADLAQGQLDPNLDSENNPAMLSVFTYFGQFIDHDLTLDTSPSPLAPVDPTTLTNNRTLRFDLDSVYGGGPAAAPQLYEADGTHFRVQNPNVNGVPDLPRNPDGSAILVEGRNDENQVISQIHLAWLLTHNRLVDSGLSFTAARAQTIRLYQTIVLREVLPHFVGQPTVDQLLTSRRNGEEIRPVYKPGDPKAPMTPVEFSVASYRFGHSMVRRAYRLQPGPGGAAGVNIQVFSPTAPDLRGGRPLTADRKIDWGNFVPELTRPENVASVNISRKIDPLISSSLFVLPIPGAEAAGSNVLAFRNMIRAKFYDMPSGQAVARAMGLPVITPEELNLGPAFATGTPLWYYLLAESSRMSDGVTLGPVGARITTDVFLRVLDLDRESVLSVPQPQPFTLADLFVSAGLATRP
jgi:hypothetical protein